LVRIRDVFQDRLATVAEARRLDGGNLDDAADGVDHQGGQRLAFHFLGHDQQRLASLGDGFQHRQQLADVGDLLVVDQDERVVQFNLLRLLVVDEVRRQVAAIELHAFDDVELILETRTFLDRDHAFLADLLHRGGDDVADVGVGVGRDRADLGDFLVVCGRVGELLQLADGGRHGLVDAALQVHRVDAGGHGLEAFLDERLCQHGRGGGAVTGDVGRLGSGFLDDLRTEILVASASSISFATDTPSLVIVGAPKLFSSTTLRPFGPRVTLTALARVFTPLSMRARASSPKRTSLAAISRDL
jgi:hypothetical protein